MATRNKTITRVILFVVNFPIIRHLLSVAEVLILFFWRNYFGDGTYVNPDPVDIEMLYDLWAGKYKGRDKYI